MIVTGFAWFTVVGLLGLGLSTLPLPALMSGVYGVPVTDPSALSFVRATGARDVAIGLILGPLLWVGDEQAAGIVMLALAVLAAFDFVNARAHGAPRSSLAVHGGGLIALAVVGAAMLQRATV